MAQYNVDIVGSLTNTNGVLSGFSSSNYATFDAFAPGSTSYEIVAKINSNNISTEQMIYYFGDYTKSYGALSIRLDQSNVYVFFGKSNSPQWDIRGNTTLQANTDYWIKLTFNGSNQYQLYLSTDGETYTSDGSKTNSNKLGDTNTVLSQIGIVNSSLPFNGTIDLNKSYIKVNGTYWWRGVTNTTKIQLRRDTASNWTSVNPILAEGEVGVELDTNTIKIGNGSDTWNELNYATIDRENLEVILGDKQDYFETSSPLQLTWDWNSVASPSSHAVLSSSGILSDTSGSDYWAVSTSSLPNYYANQLVYWEFHVVFKTSSNSSNKPLFAIDDSQVNFVELFVTNGYLETPNAVTNISIPTNTWVDLRVIHYTNESTVKAILKINNTEYTVDNILPNDYTLASNKSMNWVGVSTSPFEYDMTWNGFYWRTSPNSAKYMISSQHLGLSYTPVNKAGDTMSGALTVSGDMTATGQYYKKYPSTVSKGTNPSSNANSIYAIIDGDSSHTTWQSNRLGGVAHTLSTTGESSTVLMAYKNETNSTVNAQIKVGIYADGTTYCTFPNTTCVDGQWVVSSSNLASSVSLAIGNDQTLEYDLSSYLPSDSYKYEVLISVNAQTGNSSGAGLNMSLSGKGSSNGSDLWYRICDTYARGSWYMNIGNNAVVPIGTDRKLVLHYTVVSKVATLNNMYVEGYRRIGTNS